MPKKAKKKCNKKISNYKKNNRNFKRNNSFLELTKKRMEINSIKLKNYNMKSHTLKVNLNKSVHKQK